MRYALVLLVLLLVIPVAGQTITYNAPSGIALSEIQIKNNIGTHASIDLYLQNGQTISGSWVYEPHDVIGPFELTEEASITLSGESNSVVFVTPGFLYVSIYTARNLTETASNRLIMGAGQFAGVNNIAVEKDGLNSAIIGFKIVSDKDVTYTVQKEDLKATNENLAGKSYGEIIDQVRGYWGMAWGVFTTLAYWLKFLFWDNLVLVSVLYITGTMAYAANSSKNIFKFYKTWFKQQMAFLHFIANIYSVTISIITQIAQALHII
jgi:hypothetical protein